MELIQVSTGSLLGMEREVDRLRAIVSINRVDKIGVFRGPAGLRRWKAASRTRGHEACTAGRYFPVKCSTSRLFSWQMYSIISPLSISGWVVNCHCAVYAPESS